MRKKIMMILMKKIIIMVIKVVIIIKILENKHILITVSSIGQSSTDSSFFCGGHLRSGVGYDTDIT